MISIPLSIEKLGETFAICAGVSVLDRFSSQEEAEKKLNEDRIIYEFWADSASVQMQNNPMQ